MEQQTLWIIIGCVVAGTLLWVLILVCCCYYCKRNSRPKAVSSNYHRFPSGRRPGGCQHSSVIGVKNDGIHKCPHNKWTRGCGSRLSRSPSIRSLPARRVTEPVYVSHVPAQPPTIRISGMQRSNSLPRNFTRPTISTIQFGPSRDLTPNPGSSTHLGKVYVNTGDIKRPLSQLPPAARVQEFRPLPQIMPPAQPPQTLTVSNLNMNTDYGQLRQQLQGGNTAQFTTISPPVYDVPQTTLNRAGSFSFGSNNFSNFTGSNTIPVSIDSGGPYSAVHRATTRVYHGPTVTELPTSTQWAPNGSPYDPYSTYGTQNQGSSVYVSL